MLHYVAIAPAAADLGHVPEVAEPDLMIPALAAQFNAQCWGLTPGFHRLAFDDGHVLLTLCLGAADALLRSLDFNADSVWLGRLQPASDEPVWDTHRVKALARCCRVGTRVAGHGIAPALRSLLSGHGFVPDRPADADDSQPTAGELFAATFDPPWRPRRARDLVAPAVDRSTAAIVIGAGLAGAAVAASLARRGQRVTLLDAAPQPAAGASSLPAGLLAPHVSADDNVLSQLSRAGIRQTLALASGRLQHDVDWRLTGVLELRPDAMRALGADRSAARRDWSDLASPEQLAAAGCAGSSAAIWHRRAGWIKPAALVRALLADPRIEFRGGARVARLVPCAGGWQALDETGAPLAEAPLLVIAAGHESRALAPMDLPLQPIRGQLCFGVEPSGAPPIASFPVNGHGSFTPGVPLPDGRCWIAGATFQRYQNQTDLRADDQLENLNRLHELLPHAAAQIARGSGRSVQGWAGVRCAAPDRLPVVGPIDPARLPGLWIASAMGSRGLTFALLCGELLAARLWGEPLPVSARLARVLDARRWVAHQAKNTPLRPPKRPK